MNNQNKTEQQITRKYHLFDAKGKILGRLATEVAKFLSGKNRVDYSPHRDQGDFVVVINAGTVDVTGNKEKSKVYNKFSGYPGGISEISLEELRERDAKKIIENAVYGMLAKNKLQDKKMKRLFVYSGPEHQQKIIHVTHN
jgi:large subunit ribosomal protein L13